MNCICTETFVRGCPEHDVVASLRAALRRVIDCHEEGGPHACCRMAGIASDALGEAVEPRPEAAQADRQEKP